MRVPFTQRRTVLDNGLRVVTVELPHLHSATLVMYARVGSRYEDAADNGLSHFLEHMLFRGTAQHPDVFEINHAIESLGGTLYAETGRDYSLYQLSLAPDTVAEGLDLFAEIFHAPTFDGIDAERKIILEEILEDLDEDGKDVDVSDVARAAMFAGHPLGFKITGPYANVERFAVADVKRHFARCYGAANMVLAVAGKVFHEDALGHARRTMATLPSGNLLASPPPAPLDGGPRFVYVSSPGSQTSLQLLFRAFAEPSPDTPAMLALGRILDDGMSTRLHHRICDQLGLCYYVSGYYEAYSDTGMYEVDATCAHATVPVLVRELLGVVGDLRTRGPTPDELEKAKRRYRWDLDSWFDDPDAMASWWAGTELYYPPHGYREKLARMEAVTAEDVKRVAARVFRPEQLVVAAVGVLDRGLEGKVRDVILGWR